jgi:hypothetical protein
MNKDERSAATRTTVFAGAALALGAVIAFWPVVAGTRSFFHTDLRYEVVPLWQASQKAILSGESPFWMPGQYCGHPTLLLQETPLLYPLTIPLLATGGPAHRLADLYSLFHFWLAGFAMFLLARGVGTDFFSGLFCGVAWMLSARLVQSALWPNAVAVSALLPLLLLGVFRIARGERRPGVLLAATSGGLALLAFRPHVLVGAAPLLLSTVIAAFVASQRRWRTLMDILRAALLAAAIGAPALLPAVALYPLSSRAAGLTREERNLWPIKFAGGPDQVLYPVDGRPRWPEAAAYPGFAAGVLFLVGVVLAVQRRRTFPRVLFAALAFGGSIGLVFAFGEAGPYGLFAELPILRSLRVPARYLVSWSFALAFGSGLALSYVLAYVKKPRLIGALAVLVLSIDLIWHARRVAPTRPSEIYTAEPASLSLIRRSLSTDEAGFPHRYWSFPPPLIGIDYASDSDLLRRARALEPLSGGLGMRFGLENVGGAAATTLQASQALFEKPTRQVARLAGAASIVESLPLDVLPQEDPAAPPPRHVVITNVVDALPRAIVVPEAIRLPASAAMNAVLDSSFDAGKTAIVESIESLARRPGWKTGSASVRLRARETARLELSARLPDDAVLVVSESYEKGWRATIDGRPAPVFRANAAFLGVRLTRGEHVVRFEYRPRGLAEGLALAAVGAFALVVWARRLPAEKNPSHEHV